MTEKQIIESFEQYVNTQHDEYRMVIEYGDKRNEQIEQNLKILDRRETQRTQNSKSKGG